ncbi:PREDICTED: cytochrome P450 4C1-like [Polistes dominula]|uniref:Cytochrome P450 4C1-like n=1 Tax=Polistes dominula TaxID=743375 RepID=A0ABM1J471_POLDO|nr:PREDICTED: cytochrome P450 4C1-like [Polistes dominula]
MLLEILLGLILLLFIFHCYLKYGRAGRLMSLIPGPKEYPIIGNLHHFQVDNEHLLQEVWKMSNKCYPIFKVWTFHFAGVALLDPKDIEVLLKSNEYIEKGIIYKYLMPWFSTGLLISGGQKWHLRRKMLTPAFHFNILNYYFNILNEESQNLVKYLKKEGNGNYVVKDLQTLISQYTLNAICRAALGIQLKENGELETKYRNAVHIYGKTLAYRIPRPWFLADIIFALSSAGRQQKEVLKTLHSFSRKIIEERKRFHEETNGKYLQIFDNVDENDVFNKKMQSQNKLSMLDLLIAESWKNNRIDDEGIREEVDTFIFEGHDTTASALCFALCLFAKHKDVQEKIRHEINTFMEEDDKFTMSSIHKLTYLERCLKESLRLYPSVHVIFRQIPKDMQLKDYLIPSGMICAIVIHSVHRNPEYWPNPNVFDPDRFLPENTKKRHPYSYIPFSAGPRNCIGQKFAMYELKLIVASTIYNFELEPVDELDDVTFSADITLRSLKPLRIKFIPIR